VEGHPGFSGRVNHALDAKGRLVVPSKYRDRLGKRFILTIPFGDRCLVLYTMERWAVKQRLFDEFAVKDKAYYKYSRAVNQMTEEVECDAQGRLFIPQELRDYAGLVEKVRSVGNGDRIEIWDPERLDEVDLTSDEAAAFAARVGL
jgi:MraZ protein